METDTTGLSREVLQTAKQTLYVNPTNGRSCEKNADTTGFSRVVLQFRPRTPP
jgi:hypothetical protein